MKKQNKWIVWMISFVLWCTCLMPSQIIYGQGASVEILEIEVSKSGIQPGESFELKLKVRTTVTETSNEYYICGATASGSAIDSQKSNPSFSVEEGDSLPPGSATVNVHISGLIYSGSGKDINAVVQIGFGEDYNNMQVSGSDSKGAEVSGKTNGEIAEVLMVEKQENFIVKTGQSQNIEVKLTNKGAFTINQAEMKLALGSKVEGVEIKTDTSTVRNIKSKETKAGSFNIKVSEDAKAGVYPATVSIGGNSYPINLQVDSSVVPSALEVRVSGSKVYTPGVGGDITFNLSNVGQRDAKNIRFEVVNSEHIAIVEGGNVKRIDLISGKSSQNISMKLRVNSDIKEDSIPLQIKLEYLSSTGEKEEDVQYVYISTSASNFASEVVISNVIAPTGTYGVDQNFTVKFNVSSKGGAENLKISVKGDEGIVPKSQNLFFVNKLEIGETKQYSVTFAATNAAITGSHPIEVNIEYGDGKAPIVISQYGSIYINNPKKDAEEEEGKLKGKPRVIIGQYVVNPIIVQAGENFELELGFLNTSNQHTVSNLKANIKVIEQGENQTGNVFTPVGGSNTFYIAQLNPGETLTKTVTMYTIPTAKPKTYEITLEMVYEDEEGNEITATENVGIPVEQMTKIETGDIFVENAQVGIGATLSATLYNRGRTDVSNMMVYIEGEGFTVENNRTFIGNFKQGDSQTYEPMIMANQSGALSGELVVEYEDATGNPQEIRKPFEFQAEEMMMEEPMPLEGEEGLPLEEGDGAQGGKANKLWIFAGVGTGVIIAGTITLIVLKKRKAKKEEMMLDEEE